MTEILCKNEYKIGKVYKFRIKYKRVWINFKCFSTQRILRATFAEKEQRKEKDSINIPTEY